MEMDDFNPRANEGGQDKCDPAYWFLSFDDRTPEGLEDEELPEPDTAALVNTKKRKTKPTFIPNKLSYLRQRLEYWERTYKISKRVYTSNNTVEILVDGYDYMQDLYQNLTTLQGGDFLYAVGWQFTKEQILADDAVEANNASAPLMGGKNDAATLSATLVQMRNRGVDVRFLIWKGPVSEKVHIVFPQKEHEDFAKLINQSGGRAIVDAKTPEGLTSHHQKVLVLGSLNAQKTCAYVGGMDLATDRRDTTNHIRSKAEDRFVGWHDVQVRVQGEAVQHIWANFADRWSDHKNAAPLTLQPPSSRSIGTQHVQVLRTLGTKKSGTLFKAMPNGEKTILQAYQKAIGRAEYYIYIEEQFLWNCDIATSIRHRLAYAPMLKVILMLAAESEFPYPLKAYHYHLRYQFLDNILRHRAPGRRQFGEDSRIYPYVLYQPAGKPIYVHSKLMIIDDRYVAVGSANVNNRSMTTDTEMSLGIVDSKSAQGRFKGQLITVCDFALRLRQQLWREHLNEESKLDIDDAIRQWPSSTRTNPFWWPKTALEAEETQKHHARCLTRNDYSLNPPLDFRQIMDPKN